MDDFVPESCVIEMDGNGRKRFFLAAVVLLTAVIICTSLYGCKDKNGTIDELEGPEYIIPMSASVTEKEISVNMVLRDCTADKVVMNVYDGKSRIGSTQHDISVTKQQGTNITLTLDNFKNKLPGNIRAEICIYGKADAANKINEEPLDTAVIPFQDFIVQLNADTVNCVVDVMSVDEKARLVTGLNILTEHSSPQAGAAGASAAFDKYGIPSMLFADGAAGIALEAQSTVYPSASVVASTWNTAIAEKVGAALGRDARHFNIDMVLAPGMNIQRDVLSGNYSENFSEDPLLTGYMGAAYVNGIQSEKVGATLRNFALNNQETNKTTINANISERALREIYLTGFEIAVGNAAPYAVMTSLNQINGTYASVSQDLLYGILRAEWGYRGLTMSGWNASGAKKDMIAAQNDLSMPGYDADAELLANAVKNGELSEEEIDRCCIDILRIVARSNTFRERNGGDLDQEGGAAVSKEAAAEGMVLLKNENGALPAGGKNIALFGNAQVYTKISGSGTNTANATYAVSFLQGFENAGFQVDETLKNLYSQCKDDPQGEGEDGNPAVDTNELSIPVKQIRRAAANNDFAVICISRQTRKGEDHRSGTGDFLLNDRETKLIETVSEEFHKVDKTVTVLLNSGNPVETVSWRGQVDAILYTGLAGMDTGTVAADIIAGTINPSGKLTGTFPVSYSDSPTYGNFPGTGESADYREDLYVGYRFYKTFDIEPAYPFGYGLSYTTFAYSDMSVSSNVYTDSLSVTVTVKNTGSVAGKEIVQLYIQKPGSRENEQPQTVLASFAKTDLIQPGATQKVTLTIDKFSMRSYSEANAEWYIGAGVYSAYIAPSVENTKKSDLSFHYRVENRFTIQDVKNRCSTPENLLVFTQTGENAYAGLDRPANLAYGKTVTSNCYEGTYSPEYAVDADADTFWSGNTATEEENRWLSVDLGEVSHISAVSIDWEIITAPFSVEIRNSAEEEWTELKRYASDFEQETRLNVDTAGRYIRVRIDKRGLCGIRELEVYP